jgi:hypothetical protein
MWISRPCGCNLVSATKQFLGFSWYPAQNFLAKNCPVRVFFVKIEVTVKLYFERQIRVKCSLFFFSLSSSLAKFGIGDVHRNLQRQGVSWKSAHWKTYFRYGFKYVSIRMFHIYGPICVKFGTTHLHIKLLSICEFHENRSRQGRAFL